MSLAPPRTVHVVGAGLAGLSAAVHLAAAGERVSLYEAAGHAGGRCRSFFDTQLGAEIDNGNHLLLAGNRSVIRYLRLIGAEHTLATAATAAIPFVDLEHGLSWSVCPNAGYVPWWIFSGARRAPQSRARDHLAALKLLWCRPDATVAEVFGRGGQALRRFWEPLAVAVLNTAAEEGAARLLRALITEIFARGAAASRPCIAREGLSRSFIDPAIDWLGARGVRPQFNTRVRTLVRQNGRIASLDAGDASVTLAAADRIVLAVPPPAAAELLPGLRVPDEFRPIVNLHFKLDRPARLPGGAPLLGIVGGTAQWLFARKDILSVTISAAQREVDMENPALIAAAWRDISRALARDAPPPPCRIVREKRATFAQTPWQLPKRPRASGETPSNVVLAGDWTDTGLPATIEGAIWSGQTAARLLLRR